MVSAADWARALRHWPYDRAEDGRAIDEALEMLPVGVWWVDALSDAPAYWSAWLGNRLVARGDPFTALLALDQAAAIDSQFASYPPRARALRAVGEVAAARAYLDEILSAEPRSKPALMELARHQASVGEHGEASATYLRLLAIDGSARPALLAAVRQAVLDRGASGGLALVDGLEESGQGGPDLSLLAARIEAEAHLFERCVRRIDDAGLVDLDVTGARAGRIRRECVAGTSAVEPLPLPRQRSTPK
jgi:tetratricopeptide (TPR) repeat protein